MVSSTDSLAGDPDGMTQTPKRRLGRGLAALIGDDASEEAIIEDARNLRHIAIELLNPNPNNPRKHFTDELSMSPFVVFDVSDCCLHRAVAHGFPMSAIGVSCR